MVRNHWESVSLVGPCWDNAPVESFFGRLRCELGVEVFDPRAGSWAVRFAYLAVFANRVRRHSCLGFVSPVEYDRTDNQTQR